MLFCTTTLRFLVGYGNIWVRSNNARRQERNFNYAPERVHIFPYLTNNLLITYALHVLSQKA